MPIGDDAAGGADDGVEGEVVPGLEGGFADEVDASEREESVGVGVDAVADAGEGGGEALPGGFGVAVEHGGGGGEADGIFQIGCGRCVDLVGICGGGELGEWGGAVEHGSEPAFLEDGLVDQAEDGGAVVEEGDEGGECGEAAGECAGAVDGVDGPGPFGVGAVVAELFADQAVRGVAALDGVAQGSFDGAVGFGDGRAVGFGLDRDLGAEGGDGDGSGGVGEIAGEVGVEGGDEFSRVGHCGC